MKKIGLLGILLSMAMLSACSGRVESPQESTAESSATTSEAMETATETTTVTVSETEKIKENKEIPEPAEEYVEVSPNNRFIDFEFIEDYQGTTDIGELADKAVEFLTTTEEYAESMENIEKFTGEEFAPYIKDGKIVPKFNIAFPNDYNGDGYTEMFMIVDMPKLMGGDNTTVRNFVIFSDSYEDLKIVDDRSGFVSAQLLNYGKYKQIIIGGNGITGADELYVLYGVFGLRVEELYSDRVEYYKENCFLTTKGWMQSGEFMYYDTAKREYRSIIGVQLTVDEIKEMDKDGVLSEYYENDEYNDRIYGLVGGKYYCVNFGTHYTEAVFTYDGGKFELVENSNVRFKLENNSSLETVVDIDIEQALASMKKPIEPFISAPSDAEFIDYNLIANYPGTTDIGGLADKAVEFLKTADEYADSMKNIKIFTEEGLRRIYMEHDYDGETREEMIRGSVKKYSKYLGEDGTIVPKLNIAYPNDYDGDGKEEAFIVVDMPVRNDTFVSQGTIQSFLIFAGNDGKMQLMDSFSGEYPAVLLDYGDFKQIAIGGSGSCGAEDHTRLYGVRNGRAVVLYSGRCGFYKEDCFLAVYGWQGSGDFMYYDINAGEYFALGSVPINTDEVKKLDKDNVLKEYYDMEEAFFVYLIGGKYYCVRQGVMDTGTIYAYENGRLVLRKDCYARCSEYYSGVTVTDLDADKAIAQMKPVEKPLSPITKGSTPIDFKYIENPESAADLDRYKEIIGEFVNESIAYGGSNVYEMTTGGFADYVDQYGMIAPKITAAYTNDYDGDGKEETFVVFELPCPNYDGKERRFEVQSFTTLINSNGEINSAENYHKNYGGGDAVLLEYGNKKHMLFIDSEKHAVWLYGVRNGNTKEYFIGWDCTVKKNGCLLEISYGEGGCCMLYYDNLADDYVTLSGRNFFDGSSMPNPVSIGG